jgi:hypothetical protein
VFTDAHSAPDGIFEHQRVDQRAFIVIVFADASLSLIDIKQRQRRLPSSGVALGARGRR